MYKYPSLTPDVRDIVKHGKTERPHSGDCDIQTAAGTYLCRACGLPLFSSHSQFTSNCGWPSFNNHQPQALKQQSDPDGQRTEISCQQCDAHLGHVFFNEGFDATQTRHCVNSLAIEFIPHEQILQTDEAIVAGGCFWGIEEHMRLLAGVLLTQVGYTGGGTTDPNYHQVCQGSTGHAEATRVIFDSQQTDYQSIIKAFLQIHDPYQQNGQGPDIGSQYRSAIFYHNHNQQQIATQLLDELTSNSNTPSTQLQAASDFWPAEDYHQQYFLKNKPAKTCHLFTKRF